MTDHRDVGAAASGEVLDSDDYQRKLSPEPVLRLVATSRRTVGTVDLMDHQAKELSDSHGTPVTVGTMVTKGAAAAARWTYARGTAGQQSPVPGKGRKFRSGVKGIGLLLREE